MRLKVLVATEVLVDREVAKVRAEARNGGFCLLPRHVDFTTALVPGILSFDPGTGEEVFVAVDGGILVKCGPEVLVSTREAVTGADLGQLKRTVEEKFEVLDDHERTARSALAKIEAGFVRRFLEIQKYG